LFDFLTGGQRSLGNPCHQDSKLQLNDGKVDPQGRFVVGSVHTSARTATAALYVVDTDLGVRTLAEGFIVSNGPCWSSDGGTFYVADSVRAQIYAYEYDLARGTVSGQRPFANVAAFGGIPDGATCDSEGYLWTAICGGGKVLRLKPNGDVDRVIAMPTPLVSSVMFGGANLDRLFVTSIDPAAAAAEIEMAADTPHRSDENSGALYVIDELGVTGLPERRFAG
jgi:sugar lactone lactonase YvrE